MMWYYGNGGWGSLLMMVMMLIFWGGLIAVAVWAIGSGLGSRRSDPMDVLRRRLAAGEISQDDFEERKRILQGGGRPRWPSVFRHESRSTRSDRS